MRALKVFLARRLACLPPQSTTPTWATVSLASAGAASVSARFPTERDGESRPSNTISPPQARRARQLHPPFFPTILNQWATLIKTESTHPVLGHPHQRGAQTKREPSGVRPQRLSPCSGREIPDVDGTLGQRRRFVKPLRSSIGGRFHERLIGNALRTRSACRAIPTPHTASRPTESHPPRPWAKDG